jgi:8-oxo-dGTP pyrophosphatase MutT (NUDIX family)
MHQISTITLVCGEEIFLVKRSEDVDASNLWAAPGGSVDPNEDPAHAALREFEEETSTDLRSLGVTEANLLELPSLYEGERQVHFFYTNIPPEKKDAIKAILNFENVEARWLSYKDIPSARHIHPHYVSALNYVIKWEIDKDSIPIGRRAGLDVAVPGSEQDDRQISALAERIYDEYLASQVQLREAIIAKISVMEQILPELAVLETRENAEINELNADYAKVRKAYDVIAKLNVNNRSENLAELMYPTKENYDSDVRHYRSAEYNLKTGDRFNFLKIVGNSKPQKWLNGIVSKIAAAYEATQVIAEVCNKHGISEGEIFKELSRVERGVEGWTHNLIRRKYELPRSEIVKSARAVIEAGGSGRIDSYICQQGGRTEDVCAELERLQRMLEEKEYDLPSDLSRLRLVTVEGLKYMPEKKKAVLIEAVENSNNNFATFKERQAAIEDSLRYHYKEDPLIHELDMLPPPLPGKTYVYHSSSHLFHMPSEEYIIRPPESGAKGRGSEFTGIGFYTTVSTERAASYVGGSSADSTITRLFNGLQVYIYEIDINDANTIVNQAASPEQELRVDEILAKRGTSLANLCFPTYCETEWCLQ